MTSMKTYAALAGVAALFAVGQAQAQITTQPAAPLANAMTERQARMACRTEVGSGRREGRKAVAKKMQLCMQNKMNGNNR